MSMTEDEARTKWCPLAEQAASSSRCIASECAAWRWQQSPEQTQLEKDLGLEESRSYGYCGLAGKP